MTAGSNAPSHPSQHPHASSSGAPPVVRTNRDPFSLVGTTVGQKYAIESVIGEGGYGVVYSAQHLLIKKPVAVKCMKPLGMSAEDTARATGLFLREAQMLFSMSHPGIVRLYDVGTLMAGFAEVPYAVLELVEGRSLEQDIETRARENRPYSRDELRQLFVGVLEALAFTHDAGVAHRDLKPSNVMLVPVPVVPVPSSDGSPPATFRTKVLDFGVARFVAAQSTKQSTGMTGFTPAYAAPEQWTEGFGDPGPATDVFSVALTLAEACTLRTVMDARTPAQIFGIVMAAGRKVDVTMPNENATGASHSGGGGGGGGSANLVPTSLQLVIDRALQVRPSSRYANAREMLADVESAFANNTVSAATIAITSAPMSEAAPTVNVNAPTPPNENATVPFQSMALPFPAPKPTESMQPPPMAMMQMSPDPRHPTAPSPLSPPLYPMRHPSVHPGPLAMGPMAPPMAARQSSRIGPVLAIAGTVAVLVLGGIVVSFLALRSSRHAAAPTPAAVASASALPTDSPASMSANMTMTSVALSTGTQYSPTQIALSVNNAKEDFLRCQRTAVTTGGAPGIADVMLFVTIHPTGFVWNVLDLNVIDPIPGKADRWANLCMTGIASALRFPAHDKDDLTGAVIKLRFRPGVPDESPPPEGTSVAYESSWIKEKPKTTYPAYDVMLHTHGRIVTYDYKDGVGVCLAYNEKLNCRWVQIDSNGRTTLERKADGALFEGRWGFGEDDHTEGTWKLALKSAATKPKKK